MVAAAEATGATSMPELIARVPGASAATNIFVLVTLVTGNASHLQLVSSMMFDVLESFIAGDFGLYVFGAGQKAVLLAFFIACVLP